MKLKGCLIITSLIFSSIFFSSCSNSNKTVSFILSKSFNKSYEEEFINDIETLTNKKIDDYNRKKINDGTYNQIPKISIKLKLANSDLVKKQKILNGSADFAFINVPRSHEYDYLLSEMDVKISAQINSFVFDSNIDSNLSNPNDDSSNHENMQIDENHSLRKIADEQNKLFNEVPFKDWSDEEFKWNGKRYNKFYTTNLVSRFRGMILFSGTDQQINDAIKFWNEKDWNSFRNLGIITGPTNSQGLYLLQENLLHSHFGDDPKNNLTTLAEDKLKHPSKYVIDPYGTSMHGKNADYVISFSESGSFSWTHNKGPLKDNFFTPRDGAKIKIFTVTNWYPYDIGVFSKKLDENYRKFITESIIELGKQDNKNNYGNSIGYNGYEEIKYPSP